jgi:hypothetical protein
MYDTAQNYRILHKVYFIVYPNITWKLQQTAVFKSSVREKIANIYKIPVKIIRAGGNAYIVSSTNHKVIIILVLNRYFVVKIYRHFIDKFPLLRY